MRNFLGISQLVVGCGVFFSALVRTDSDVIVHWVASIYAILQFVAGVAILKGRKWGWWLSIVNHSALAALLLALGVAALNSEGPAILIVFVCQSIFLSLFIFYRPRGTGP